MSDSHKLLWPISPGSAPIRMTSKFYSLNRAEHAECPERYGSRGQERNIVESFRWKTGWGTEKYFEQWSRWLPCFHVLRISDSRRLEICYAEGQVLLLRFGLSKAELSAWMRHAFLLSERLWGQGTGGISVHFQSKHNSNSEQWQSHPNSSNSNLPCNIYSIHSTWQGHMGKRETCRTVPPPLLLHKPQRMRRTRDSKPSHHPIHPITASHIGHRRRGTPPGGPVIPRKTSHPSTKANTNPPSQGFLGPMVGSTVSLSFGVLLLHPRLPLHFKLTMCYMALALRLIFPSVNRV